MISRIMCPLMISLLSMELITKSMDRNSTILRIIGKELIGLMEGMMDFVGVSFPMFLLLAFTMLSITKDGWLFHRRKCAASVVIVLMVAVS